MKRPWRATYRLQLHAEFPLAAAERLLPYLAELGISHVYLSPCLRSAKGSTHGYDVTDPTAIDEELGGEPAWTSFTAAARRHGLGVLLDFVPNHMAANAANPWWESVLAHGPFSSFANHFDIAPETLQPDWKIGLAVLGEPYPFVLTSGDLRLDLAGTTPRLRLHGDSWPLAPATWGALLPEGDRGGSLFERLAELSRVATPDETQRATYHKLADEAAAAWQAAPEPGRLARALEIGADADRLHALLERQYYALHFWKRANEVVNYRRFFDVNGLVGVRVERDDVFNALHVRLKAALEAGDIQGVRIDHPDGLRDPRGYCRKLRTLIPEGRVFLEKILDASEQLRESWPVDGTTGYDFLATVNRLWMDAEKAEVLAGIYAEFTGHPLDINRIIREKKARIADDAFAFDIDRLADIAARRADAGWRTRDLGHRNLRQAIAAASVSLPVYRTYRDATGMDEEDRRLVKGAIAAGRGRLEPNARAAMDYLEQLLLCEPADPDAAEFIARWQQLTPAITAKGVEDTTFYCYDRLLSCNEVGAQAALLGIAAEKFHEFCHHLSVHWPHTMLATSTHDNKRSEDVRTRISVISENTDAWRAAITSWSRMNRSAWQGRAPDRHAEYLLYQTLVGAHPLEFERAWAYMCKALREAKIHTSWHRPNREYEESVRDFLAAILANPEFTASLAEFSRGLVGPGRVNSLAQTLIKLTAPGVPDFYQGSELWDLSLVDPDNRRPVDYETRLGMLAGLADVSAGEVMAEWDSGRPKLWLIARVLRLRSQHPEWFDVASSYAPLTARGARAGHVLGFQRSGMLCTLVPRFTAFLQNDWRDTLVPLPGGAWEDLFTGRQWIGGVTPPELFRGFPVALLVKVR